MRDCCPASLPISQLRNLPWNMALESENGVKGVMGVVGVEGMAVTVGVVGVLGVVMVLSKAEGVEFSKSFPEVMMVRL